ECATTTPAGEDLWNRKLDLCMPAAMRVTGGRVERGTPSGNLRGLPPGAPPVNPRTPESAAMGEVAHSDTTIRHRAVQRPLPHRPGITDACVFTMTTLRCPPGELPMLHRMLLLVCAALLSLAVSRSTAYA